MIYQITPVPKPRQTQRDRWKKRPCVLRYRAFADQVRAANIQINDGGEYIRFYIPMPPSWSKKKKQQMDLTPHQQKPDIDNLIKALLDAVFDDDSHIYDIRAKKMWAHKGAIGI